MVVSVLTPTNADLPNDTAVERPEATSANFSILLSLLLTSVSQLVFIKKNYNECLFKYRFRGRLSQAVILSLYISGKICSNKKLPTFIAIGIMPAIAQGQAETRRVACYP
jgi:hypothetical protein